MAKKDLKLKSEAFHHSYSLSENGGKMLEGWEAKHLGGKQFQIKRKDGSTKIITLGDNLGAAGIVSAESNGVSAGAGRPSFAVAAAAAAVAEERT